MSNLKKRSGTDTKESGDEKKEGVGNEVDAIDELFPFKIYFLNAPQPLFKRKSYAEDWDVAQGKGH